jgi:hypothetical protein
MPWFFRLRRVSDDIQVAEKGEAHGEGRSVEMVRSRAWVVSLSSSER